MPRSPWHPLEPCNAEFKVADDKVAQRLPARAATPRRAAARWGLHGAQRQVVVGRVEPDLDARVVEPARLAHAASAPASAHPLDAVHVEGPDVAVAARAGHEQHDRRAAPKRSGAAATMAGSCSIQLRRSCAPGTSGSSCVGPEKVILPASRWKFAAWLSRPRRRTAKRSGATPAASIRPWLAQSSSVTPATLPSSCSS